MTGMKSFAARFPRITRLGKAFSHFVAEIGNAALRSWSRVGFAVASGIIFIIFAERIRISTVALIVQHIGVGMIVAGIAVFGYEYRSHARELIKRIDALTELIKVRALVAIEQSLLDLFPDVSNPANQQLRTALSAAVGALNKLETRNSWNVEVYVRLIVGLLGYASDNAEKLVGVDQTPRGWDRLKFPTAADIADEMLTAQMAVMSKGDRYEVVSDFASWGAKQLPRFLAATKDKTEHGVVVRRVFCVFAHDYDLKFDDVVSVIDQHWAAARQPNTSYEVAFVLGGTTPAHEGVFVHGARRLRFKPVGSNLAEMEFLTFDLEPKDLDRKTHSEFARTWEASFVDSEIGSDDRLVEYKLELEKKWKAHTKPRNRKERRKS